MKQRKKNIAHDNKNLSERTINNMEIFYSNEPWFYIDGFLKIIIFTLVGLFLSILSLILIFFNKCSSAFLYPEFLKKAISTILSNRKKNLAKKYLFHYSETYYRPLWTYVIDDNKKYYMLFLFSILLTHQL